MTSEDHDGTVYQFTPPPPSPPPTGRGPGPSADLRHPAGPAGLDEGAGAGQPVSTGEPSGTGRPRRTRRRARVTKTAAGLAVVLGAGAGAGAVIAATSSGGPTSLASTSAASSVAKPASNRAQRSFFWGMGGPFGLGMRFGGGFFGSAGALPGSVVHASYTVKGPNGAYETLDAQVGTVQAVSSSSITVKSADGYSQQYAIGSSTVVYADYNGIGSVKKGDQVSVMGLVGSSGVTAERIIDITQVRANGSTWRPQPPAPPASSAAPGSSGGTTADYNMGGPFRGDDPGGTAA